jgi:hypothetical protein
MATKSTKSTKSKTTQKLSSTPNRKNKVPETVLLRSPQRMSVAIFAFLAVFAGVGLYVYQATHAATQAQVEAFSPASSDCLAGGQSDGSTTYIATCNGSAGENWQMTAQTINNVADKTCLQIGAIPSTGNSLISVSAAKCNGSASQHWVQTNGYEMVNEAATNAGKSKCLVDPSNATGGGTAIGAVGCSTAKPQDQLWFNGTYNASKPKPSSGPGCATGIKPSPATAQCIAKELMPSYGWNVNAQFGCLQELWNQESSWRWDADNASSGAYGIPQSLPGDKMASVGADWRTNATTQMKWGMGYIKSRYSTPCGAEAHEKGYGWYGIGTGPDGQSTNF